MEREFALAYAEGVGYVHNIRSLLIDAVLVVILASLFVALDYWALDGMSNSRMPGDTYGQQSQ